MDFTFLNNLNWWQKWPPLPPVAGMLGKPGYAKAADFTRTREDWGIEEWKAYAAHLERHGARLVDELKHTKARLFEQREKSSRRKPIEKLKITPRNNKHFIRALLGEPDWKPKRGAKSKGESLGSRNLAAMAVKKIRAAKIKGGKLERWDALSQVYDDLRCKRHERKTKTGSRHILNLISGMQKAD